MQKEIRKYTTSDCPVYFSAFEYGAVHSLSGEKCNNLEFKKVNLVSGIANGIDFENAVKEHWEINNHLKFTDHHNYSVSDLNKMKEIMNNDPSESAVILTTEKDAMRLKDMDIDENLRRNIYFWPINVKILFEQQEELKNMILKQIA